MSQSNPEIRFLDEATGELPLNDAVSNMDISSDRFLLSAEKFHERFSRNNYDDYASSVKNYQEQLRNTCNAIIDTHDMLNGEKMNLITTILLHEDVKRSAYFNLFMNTNEYGNANKDRASIYDDVADSFHISAGKPKETVDSILKSYQPTLENDLGIFEAFLAVNKKSNPISTAIDISSALFMGGIVISSVISAVYRHRKHR